MAFIQDPRVRQRWNQISHTTEAVTENAAAGIWSFGHRYVAPCFGAVADGVDSCVAAVCTGADREERARRARERDRGARRSRARAGALAPEYTFDFYDDWDDLADDEEGGPGGSGILGRIAGEDWDRLLAGTAGGRRESAGEEVSEQPGRKRGMSYGTRGRRKVPEEEDPTIIPSTAPLGFLARLPFRIGGTLRYKPSAANLKEHPGGGIAHDNGAGPGHEREPLLGGGGGGPGEEYEGEGEFGLLETAQQHQQPRQRSNTAGSGGTSDSYRSRNDLFPSDGEGEEDAIPLDDEFAVALDRVVDDRGSNRTRSTKGKSRLGAERSNSGLSLNLNPNLVRTGSRTTLSSTLTRESGVGSGGLKGRGSETSMRQLVDGSAEAAVAVAATPTLEDLQREEEEARRAEDEEVERKRRRAAQLALERGLHHDGVRERAAPAAEARATEAPQGDEPDRAEPVGAETAVDDHVLPRDEFGQREEQQQKGETTDTALVRPDPDPGPPDASDVSEQARAPAAEFVPARLPHFR